MRVRKGTINETGKQYGDWTVIALDHVGAGAFWRCRCKCGRESVVRGTALRNGHSPRCADCARHERHKPARHGHARTGKVSAEYRTWQQMIQRCTNQKTKAYRDYGARGVSVCERWLSFANFINDMGHKPTPSHTIERNNTNGNYEPGNCRWATRLEQGANTRKNRVITINGETLILAEWLRRIGITHGTFRSRMVRGMSLEAALTTPKKQEIRQ